MRLATIVVTFALSAAGATAEELRVAGRTVAVVTTADGLSALTVDGTAVLTDGLVLIDPFPRDVAGTAVVTGVAGPGGNACNAAPFVLTLRPLADPVLHGPIATCAYLEMKAGPSALAYTGEPTPDTPAEVWVWSPEAGFVAGAPVPFAADPALGWDRLADLAGAHPVEALKLGQVEAQLQASLGTGWDAFAERISGLGSGALTQDGYLGEACLKSDCATDWALLFLHRRSQSAYAAWAEGGQVRLSPPDPGLWPEEAAAAVQAHLGP